MNQTNEALTDIAVACDDLTTLLNGAIPDRDDRYELRRQVRRIRKAQERLVHLHLHNDVPAAVRFASLQWGGDWTEARFPVVTHLHDDLPGNEEHECWTWMTIDTPMTMRRHRFTQPHDNEWWMITMVPQNGDDEDFFYVEDLGDGRFTAHWNPAEGGEDETYRYDPEDGDPVIWVEGGHEFAKADE